ncbi:MAG: acetyl-CoA carboxylase biotin carboxyl carrier protein subunit [Mogibacterium sp.]|nr:acetyl-CoA carboxylase biotin carboxyl carrier protein subunit [Mogibacterium sp.]MBR2539626.1 acetyl-CoA carboxylase biotin carboxyl carrier protein subunit [Mogibacterium sp.]
METYIVRVNGEEFEVEIEKKGSQSSAPAAAEEPAAKAAAPAKKPAAAKGKGEPVVCGTAGKVFKIVSSEGTSVKSGDTILILEAMKMEIPVVAPKDGTVGKIVVSVGDSTASGQTVAYIE